MGERRFGHAPRVGDAFCGGGSIPFEAARIGCTAYGSDLSPVAALLTWAALNIVGGGEKVADEVRHALQAVYAEAQKQIEEWGIERNAAGWTADAYLYCHEVRDRGWLVPLAPSWIIGERTHTIAVLIPEPETRRFRIEIRQGVSEAELAQARLEGTWENGVRCPMSQESVREDGTVIPSGWIDNPASRPITNAESLRGRDGLRRWENNDLIPRPDDIFQERLYCIRWRLPSLKDLLWQEQAARTSPSPTQWERGIKGVRVFLSPEQQAELAELRARDWHAENAHAQSLLEALAALRGQKGIAKATLAQAKAPYQEAEAIVREREERVAALTATLPETWYAAPDVEDLSREAEALRILQDRFANWQAKGYLPSAPIEPGDKTEEPIRTRGYTHWHHLFNPRQLLTLGLFSYLSDAMQFEGAKAVGCLIAIGKMADFSSRLVRFVPSPGVEKPVNTFSNQALNTLLNYAMPAFRMLGRSIDMFSDCSAFGSNSATMALDARGGIPECDIWITDPAYADAINYEELSEFFLAWYDKRLQKLFPDWYTDSKRALAVRGSDEAFRLAMVECYRNFACHMPDNGLQIVTFTHTDAEVWSDLALIMWAAGLRVSQAWTIATETDASGLKSGNYVQGTVLLVLRKQTGSEWGDLADVFPEVQREVESQMDALLALDDKSDPNFDDSDYQLAAYAAALRVLTRYKTIEDINVERELRRKKGAKSPLTELIETAVKIASNYLVPPGIDRAVWRELKPDERLYVKGLQIEAHGDYRTGVYMEFARGYGVRDYRPLLGATKANQTRLKTATEFRNSGRSGAGFGETLLRHLLYAVYKSGEEDDPNIGRLYLRHEMPNYWQRKEEILALLRYLAHTPTPAMTHWQRDREAAELLAGMIANDTL